MKLGSVFISSPLERRMASKILIIRLHATIAYPSRFPVGLQLDRQRRSPTTFEQAECVSWDPKMKKTVEARFFYRARLASGTW